MKRVFEFLDIKREKIYIVLIGIFFASFILQQSTINISLPFTYTIFEVIKYVIVGLLCGEILWTIIENKFRQSEFDIFFIFLSLIVLIFTGKIWPFCIVVLLFSGKKYDFGKTSKILYYVVLGSYFFVLFLGTTGIITNIVNYRGDGVIRYGLGFNYVLVPATLYLTILVLRVYSTKGKISIAEIISHLMFIMLLYFTTDSRCDCFLSILLLGMVILSKFFKADKVNKFVKIVCISLPVLVMVGSFLLLILYYKQVPFAIKINELLGNRLGYGLTAIMQEGVPIFGSDFRAIVGKIENGVIAQPENYIFLDNSYFSILIENGIVFLIAMVGLYCFVIKRSFDNKNYWFVILIIIMLLQSFIEPYLLYPYYNVLLLAFGEMVYKKDFDNQINVENKEIDV